MMNLFGGCGKNSSCDVLVWVILLWLLTNCGIFGGGKCGCGCEHERRECCCKCIDIDICTIIILVIMFGGKFFKGC